MPRNSSGTYSLPAGNPVVSNTLIETNWANPTMADIGQALTESLDRYGRGGMLAPFRLSDGLVTAPALAFASETSTGIYRTTAGTWNLAILGVNVFAGSATGVTINPQATFGNGAVFDGPPLRAADPATADELTRKSYVDSVVNTIGSTLFVKKVGDSMTGQLSITVPNNSGLQVFSGAAASYSRVTIGRTSSDSYIGVAGGPGQIVNGDVAGDFGVRANTGALRLAIGPVAYMTLASGAGVTSNQGLTVAGSFPALSATAIAMGSAGGLPNISWYNSTAAVDTKHWSTRAGATNLIHRVDNDAGAVNTVWLEVTRTTTTINDIIFRNGNVTVGNGTAPGVGGTGPIFNIYGAAAQPALTIHNSVSGNTASRGFMLRQNSNRSEIINFEDGGLYFSSNNGGALSMILDGSGRLGVGRTPVAASVEVTGRGSFGYGVDDALRIVSDSAYLSAYNTANSTRSGYLQFVQSGAVNLANEFAAGTINFLIGATPVVAINSAGIYHGLPSNPTNRLTRVNEFVIAANAADIPNIKFRYGKVATTIGGSGTVNFTGAFTTVYSCVVTLEGGNGSGFAVRMFNLTTSGFTFGFDNWSPTGSGNACFVHYYAVGV